MILRARPERYTCLCDACNQDFGSTSAFDAHWTGKHEYGYSQGLAMDPPRDDGRRCLSPDEMRAKGMHQDARGRWRRSGDNKNPFVTGVPRPPELWSATRA